MSIGGYGRSLARLALIALALVTGAGRSTAQLSSDPVLKPTAPVDPHRPLAQELRSSASSQLSVTAVGSLLLHSPSGAPPPFDAKVRRLLSGADRAGAPNVTVATLQTPIVDPKAVRASPFPWNAAPAIRAAPALAGSLRRQGFNAVLLATGHALDWGIEGMRATGEALDAEALVRAGTGETAGLAGHAAYYDQPGGGGRIAFVSTATTFRPTSDALDQRGTAPGRPGVNAIGLAAIRRVSPAQLYTLQKIACRFQYPNPADRTRCDAPTPASEVAAFGSTFRAGGSASEYGTSAYLMNPSQAEAFLGNIREGKQNADLLVAGIHADQLDDARTDTPLAPSFLSTLARAAIDSGADMVIATGRPVLGPIEIYVGRSGTPRPIFYGLGNFAWTAGLAPPPQDHVLDGAIVRSVVSATTLTVEIFPLDLAPGGSPRIAAESKAARIVRRLQDLSAPYGTRIVPVTSGGTTIGRITVALAPRAKDKRR